MYIIIETKLNKSKYEGVKVYRFLGEGADEKAKAALSTMLANNKYNNSGLDLHYHLYNIENGELFNAQNNNVIDV